MENMFENDKNIPTLQGDEFAVVLMHLTSLIWHDIAV